MDPDPKTDVLNYKNGLPRFPPRQTVMSIDENNPHSTLIGTWSVLKKNKPFQFLSACRLPIISILFPGCSLAITFVDSWRNVPEVNSFPVREFLDPPPFSAPFIKRTQSNVDRFSFLT